MNDQIKQVKFDFYNTSTPASVANTVLKIQDMNVRKRMTSLTAPFKVETLSGDVKNNWNGFRVLIDLILNATSQSTGLDTLITQFYTYKDSTVVQCRFYPDWDADTTNYLVVALDSPVEVLKAYTATISASQSATFALIEKQIRTSIPSFLNG